MRSAYRESAPRPPPQDWSDVDAYLRTLQKRQARWNTFYNVFRGWGTVLGWGLFIVGGIIGLVAFAAHQQERVEACHRKGGTWVQTEGGQAMCLDVREIEIR